MLRWWHWGALALTVVGIVLALVAPPPTSFGIRVGTEGDDRVVRGVQAAEQNEDGPFRWTDGAADVRFTGFEEAGLLVVAVRATPPQRSTPTALPVTFYADRSAPLHIDAAPAWRTYHFLVPRGDAGWAVPTLHMEADPVRASDADDRKVGLALSAVEAVRGAPVAPLAALQRAIFVALMLALIGFAAARTLGTTFAVVVLPILAFALAFGAWTAPIMTAFWLPQLWNAAGFGAAAVVAPPLLRWATRRPIAAHWWTIIGAAIAVVGTVLLASRLALPLGWGLLLGGSILAAVGAPATERTQVRPRIVAAVLIGTVAVALFVRFYALGSLPFGLWRDEARFGILARQILTDPAYRPIYVPGGVDYPALLFYLTAGVIRLLGVQIESVRVVAALAGSLAPLSLFFLGRRLVGTPAALVAAALMAVAAWHISISRISFVAVLDPLFTLGGLALLWNALDARHAGQARRAWWSFVLGGVLLGLAFWTYHTARILPLLVLLLCAVVLGRSWARWRTVLPGLVIAAAIVLLITSPLVYYALTQSGDFNLRMSQTSVLHVASDLALSTPAVLDMNLHSYLLMWHLYGEPNGRHYAPNRPMLDIVTGAAAMIGLWLAARRLRRTDVFLFGWFLVEFIPPLLSEGAPHAVRSVGMIAPAMLLAGSGIVALASALPRPTNWAVPISAVAVAAALNLYLYFGVMPYDPQIWGRFNAPETTIALYLRDHATEGPYAVPRRIARHDVVAYLAPNVPLTIFNRDEEPTPFPSGTKVLVPDEAPAEEFEWLDRAMGKTATRTPMAPYPGSDRPTFWLYEAQN